MLLVLRSTGWFRPLLLSLSLSSLLNPFFFPFDPSLIFKHA
ncbi:hypothetical protein FVEG_12882 [Fusarium verticillioides 7600]|uniref:Uncharacterized protein n=1 Tax=Gibberella moniliformis (strain M3125 / FGSC 7600) TaxID=334819 RepID=W7N3C9_GIBM7|nr:hypothetical protein FVEG_12882 [Fusarium verticillioides 7600]EWG54760.1 hypothetical protein FVEG_12882 [Fusarium verticillioides 7600]